MGQSMDRLASALPEGLTLHRRTDSLEIARSKVGDANLLVTSAGLEVIRGTLGKGHRLHLYPAQKSATPPTEVYMLLHGSLQYEQDGTARVLEPGDYIVAQQLATAVVFNALTDITFLYLSSQPSFAEISESLKMLKALAHKIQRKDAGETEDHCRRTRERCLAIAKALSLSQEQIHLLDYAAYFHDIGKIKVPPRILKKPGALTETEWGVIRQHPSYGRKLLEHSFIKEAGVIIEQHHERLDGSGYPFGLGGTEIAIEASIIAVADAYDAMTSNRPYRHALSHETAIGELERYAGRYYPGELVKVLETTLSLTTG
jgi:HD-GYP domain-containing protein (c-di-GMP phosphodiesterase class II)